MTKWSEKLEGRKQSLMEQLQKMRQQAEAMKSAVAATAGRIQELDILIEEAKAEEQVEVENAEG
jgi:phage shock protein A